MTLPVVTIKDIRSWNLCQDPVTYFGLPEGWHGNALELLDAIGKEELADDELLWVILRAEMLPEPLLSEVVVAIVRETPLTDGRTVKDLLTEKRRAALDARLKWSKGEITDDELYAAWAAAWASKWVSEWAAVCPAAGIAAWDAARLGANVTAALDAAQRAQVKIARRVIQEVVK